MKEVIITALEAILTAVIAWLGVVITNFIRAKVNNVKLADALTQGALIVEDAVKAVNQIYVDELKKDGKFDKTRQANALEQAKALIDTEIDPRVKALITESVGDFETWMNTQIHAKLFDMKK